MCVRVCLCVRVCAHLPEYLAAPLALTYETRNSIPEQWGQPDRVCQCPRGTGILPSSEPLPYPFIKPPLVSAISLTVLAFSDRQEGGGRQRHRQGRKTEGCRVLLGSLCPKALLSSSLGQRPTRYQQNGSSGGAVRFLTKAAENTFFLY